MGARAGDGKRREALGETEAEGGSGGWQALLSAGSDMAVGDRWQNQKVMSLLTGSACAPLISPVPPRHRRAHLRSPPLCLSVSAKLADGMAGWQAERQATGIVWSRTGASGASGTPQSESPPSLPFFHHVVSFFFFFPPLRLSHFVYHAEPLWLPVLSANSVLEARGSSATALVVVLSIKYTRRRAKKKEKKKLSLVVNWNRVCVR